MTPADLPLLIPETPTEESFTASESIVEATQFFELPSDTPKNPASTDQTGSSGAGFRPATSLQHRERLDANLHAVSPQVPGHEGHVQAAAFEEPVKSPSTSNGSGGSETSIEGMSVDLARRWIDQNVVDLYSNPAGLNFRPISLVELLRQPATTNRRTEMVNHYWETWIQWAELNSRIQFANWINNITVSGSQPEVQLLSTRKSESDRQVLEAKKLLSTAQARLESFMLPVSKASDEVYQPPLPSDNPLIHPYVTNYQLYKKYRLMPEKFRNIDRDLEDILTQIVGQTQAAQSAKSAAALQLKAYLGSQESLNSVVTAGQTWRLAEMNLIKTVAKYNQKIADYALTVSEGTHSPETISAMLIGKSGNKRSSVDPALVSDTNARSALQARQPQTGLVNQTAPADAPKSILENGSTISRDGSTTPFRPSSAANQRVIQPTQERPSTAQQFDSFGRGGSPSSVDSATGNAAAAEMGDLSPRLVPDRNDFEPKDSNPVSTGDAANTNAHPFGVESSGTAEGFNPASRSPSSNATVLNPGSPRSAQANPLAPITNSFPNGSNQPGRGELPTGKSNLPEGSSFDRNISPGGSFNPPGSQERSMDGAKTPAVGLSNTGASSPANGMFNPPEFNPQSRPTALDAKRKSSFDIGPSQVDSPESGVRPILPPETDGKADSKTFDSSFN
jgi:hypothetical protein